ncbi:hypothetical protein LY76DRAFT_650762 [Colletotrichum caudatum]|nr:hypothetical protein LY76DRAFT_650762 [Colletotrichum caudatum]
MADAPVIVSIRRNTNVEQSLRDLSEAWNDAQHADDALVETWDRLHQDWWAAARAVHQSGQHTSSRHHVLDWPSFMRENMTANDLIAHLARIFRIQHDAAKHKPESPARLRNAAAALGLNDPVELHIELHQEVCTSTAALKLLSSLRSSRAHQPVSPEDIRAELRSAMLARVFGSPGPYIVTPLPNLADVKATVETLRLRAVPRAPPPPPPPQQQSEGGASKKRRSSASAAVAAEGDDDGTEGAAAERRRSKRARLLGDNEEELDEMSRAFIDSVREEGGRIMAQFFDEESFTREEILAYSPQSSPLLPDPASSRVTASDADESEADPDAAAAERARRESRAARDKEAKQDALVLEQMQLVSRLVQMGTPSVEAVGDPLVHGLLCTLGMHCKSVLAIARDKKTPAHMEARKRQREADLGASSVSLPLLPFVHFFVPKPHHHVTSPDIISMGLDDATLRRRRLRPALPSASSPSQPTSQAALTPNRRALFQADLEREWDKAQDEVLEEPTCLYQASLEWRYLLDRQSLPRFPTRNLVGSTLGRPSSGLASTTVQPTAQDDTQAKGVIQDAIMAQVERNLDGDWKHRGEADGGTAASLPRIMVDTRLLLQNATMRRLYIDRAE